MSGDRLLARAQRGDPAALQELCEREWRPVYGIVYQAVRNPSEAQDLTQEVFLRALRSLHRYRATGAPFSSYLGTIARNLVRNRWRTKHPRMVDLGEAGNVPSADIGPEGHAVAGDDARRVRQALATLPPDYQQVVRLRVLDGRSSAEVGRLMGRSPDAVRQLQHRAIVMLRDRLREESLT